MQNCKICKSEKLTLIFNKRVLNKYNVDYYQCGNCDFIMTEEPYWLEEAYENAITNLDIGLVNRNIYYAPKVAKFIKKQLPSESRAVDYGGGYGLFVRLMRDRGFDYFWQDDYCDNLFAKGFEAGETVNYDLLTAFEVFEHLVNPMEEIERMLGYSDCIFFSTMTFDNTVDENWDYLIPSTGQHIALYANKTLEKIAEIKGMNLYSVNNAYHLLVKRKFSKNPIKNNFLEKVLSKLDYYNRPSLMMKDYEFHKMKLKNYSE